MQGQRTTLCSLFCAASLKWVLGQQACKPRKYLCPAENESNLKYQKELSTARVNLGSLIHSPYKPLICIH